MTAVNSCSLDLHGADIAAHALLQHLQILELSDCSLPTQFGDMRGLGDAAHPLLHLTTLFSVDCSLLMQFGDMRGLGGAAHALLQQAKLSLGVIAKQPGSGTANTALVYHARKLMALHEGDLPYAVRLAELLGQGVRVWGAGVPDAAAYASLPSHA